MEHGVYAVYDAVAQIFMDPFMAETPGVAERMFRTLVNNPQTKFHEYPEDFQLYAVGHFDRASGDLVSIKPMKMARADQVKNAPVGEN